MGDVLRVKPGRVWQAEDQRGHQESPQGTTLPFINPKTPFVSSSHVLQGEKGFEFYIRRTEVFAWHIRRTR
eukprot:1165309-Prorocentrum_minimum.AAC.4